MFVHSRHPWAAERRKAGPVKVADQHRTDTPLARFNTWLGLKVTVLVGTMVCAYLFAALAMISLPSALKSGDLIVIVAWIAQTFLQLVLLPVIIVGQNVQARAADRRAEQTFLDAEAILHSCEQLQEHLHVQDDRLSAQDAALAGQAQQLAGLVATLSRVAAGPRGGG